MNMDKETVAQRIQYLRDTLGRKTPKHNHMGFVERDFVSVQGFWRNSADLRRRPLPIEIETRERRGNDHGLDKVMDEIGLEGVATVLNKLRERQRLAHERALAKLPVKERVLPTE